MSSSFIFTKTTLRSLSLLSLGLSSFVGLARAETIVTIQPHTSGDGYVVTYSWKGNFAEGMSTASNGSNAYIDDNTKAFSSDYVMPSGNHAGAKIRYSQHNNDGINGNFTQVPELGANPVHYDGSDGESLTPGEWMQESSHADLGFVENGGNWYNNPDDYGGVRFFGTGVQGALSLTSWNGIDATSAYGDAQFEGAPLLGQGMQFGVNGGVGESGADSLRIGMVGDAGYWRNLDASDSNNGLLIGYFPYATNFPGGTPADKFTNQFNVGTYTSTSGDVTMTIINDSSYVPVLVSEADPFEEWSGGTQFGDDTNGDGIADGAAWLLGADSPNADALPLLPVYENSEPDYFTFTYRRSDEAIDAGATAVAQYTNDLTAGWTDAVAGADIIITPTDDGAAVGVDLVEVKLSRDLATSDKLFVRLLVSAP